MNKACMLLAIAGLCACRPPVHHLYNPVSTLPDSTPVAPSSSTPVEVRSTPIAAVSRSEPDLRPPLEPTLDVARIVEELNGRLQDVFFRFDSSDLAPDALAVLHGDADLLMTAMSRFPNLRVTVEGYCDERGSAEYNLGLGDQRARRAGDALHEFAPRLPAPGIVSYGKEAPQCAEATESCWQRNRRAHIVVRAGAQ